MKKYQLLVWIFPDKDSYGYVGLKMGSTFSEKANPTERHSHLPIFGTFCDILRNFLKYHKMFQKSEDGCAVPWDQLSLRTQSSFLNATQPYLVRKKIQTKKYYFFMEKLFFQNVKFCKISCNLPSSSVFSRRASYLES